MLQHLARLQPALLLRHQAFDDRAFGQAAAVMLAQHGEMDQDVAVDVVADEEAEAAGRVEPFDGAGDAQQSFAVRPGWTVSTRAAGRSVLAHSRYATS